MSHKALFKGRRFERDGTLSNSSSRAQSVSRTPLRSDDSDYESDTEEQDFIKIEELLKERLFGLQLQEIELAKKIELVLGTEDNIKLPTLTNLEFKKVQALMISLIV